MEPIRGRERLRRALSAQPTTSGKPTPEQPKSTERPLAGRARLEAQFEPDPFAGVPRAVVGSPVQVDRSKLGPQQPRRNLGHAVREGYERGQQAVAGVEALRAQSQATATAPDGLPAEIRATIGLPQTMADRARADLERSLEIVPTEERESIRQREEQVRESARAPQQAQAVRRRAAAAEEIADRQETLNAIPKSEVTERVLALETANPVDWVRAAADLSASTLAQAVPTILGGAAGAKVGGPFGAATGAGTMSFATEYGNSFLEGLARQEVDLSDPDAVLRAMQNDAVVEAAADRASTRASTIAGVDAVTGGVLSKVAKLLTMRSFTRSARVALHGGQMAGEVTSEAGGEALAGQLADGDVDVREVIAEVLGAMGGQAPATVEAINLAMGEPSASVGAQTPAGLVDPSETSEQLPATQADPLQRMAEIERVIGGASTEQQAQLAEEYNTLLAQVQQAAVQEERAAMVQEEIQQREERRQQLQQQREERRQAFEEADAQRTAEAEREASSTTDVAAVSDDVAELVGGQMEALKEQIYDPATPKAQRLELIRDYQTLERLLRDRPTKPPLETNADPRDTDEAAAQRPPETDLPSQPQRAGDTDASWDVDRAGPDGIRGNGAAEVEGAVSAEDVVAPALSVREQARELTSSVVELPIEELATDPARFQPRDAAFSEETANRVATNFDRQKLAPLKAWRDPKDGKLYVLGGHSRLEGQRRRQAQGLPDSETLPVKEIQGTEAEAIEYALTDNDGRSQMQPQEQAEYLRRWGKGKTKRQVGERAKELYGKNAQTVQDLAALSPKGKALAAVQQFSGADTAESRDALTLATWVGRVRRQLPDLTGSHERELTDYLLKNWRKRPQARSMGDFVQFVRDVVERRTEIGDGGVRSFDAKQPLNLANVVAEARQVQVLDERVAAAEKELKAAQAELEKQRKTYLERGASAEQLERILKPYNEAVTVAQRAAIEARQAAQKKGEVRRQQLALLQTEKPLDRDSPIDGRLRVKRVPGLTGEEAALQDRSIERATADPDGMLEEYARLKDSQGGRVIDTDLFRELFPEYAASKESKARFAQAVHAASSALANYAYEKAMADPAARGKDVLILAGGGGSGKSKARDFHPMGNVHVVVDTTLAKVASAVDKIGRALDAGAQVIVAYTHRPVEKAIQGVAARAATEGRTVPLSVVARDHFGAQQTIQEVGRRYADDERVTVVAIDNSADVAQGEQATTRLLELSDLASVQYASEQEAHERARQGYDAYVEQRAADGRPLPEWVARGIDPERASEGVRRSALPESGQGRAGGAEGRDRLDRQPGALDRNEPLLRNAPGVARRIQPAPLPGYKGKRLSEMIVDAARGLNVLVKHGKTRRTAAGSYYPGSAKVTIRFQGDLDTTAHELAHALDDRYGIVADWAQDPAGSPFDGELIPHFSQHGTPSSDRTIERAEAVAEWIRAFVVNPDAAVNAAPNFAAHVAQVLPTDVLRALEAFSNDVRQWAGASATEQTQSNIRVELPSDTAVDRMKRLIPGRGGEVVPWTARLRAEVTDSLAPLWKGLEHARAMLGIEHLLPENDPAVLLRTFAGVDRKVEDVLEHGMIDVRGNRIRHLGGVDWLMEPFMAETVADIEQDYRDAIALLFSERVVEKADQMDAAGRSDQADRMSGAGAGIRSDVAVARQTLRELQEDPERYRRLTEAARRYRLWADSVLRYLRDSGRISHEAYDTIRSQNEFYVRMERVMEGVGIDAPVVGGKRRIASARDLVKRFHGSTREVENPYLTLLTYTHQAIREADRNAAMRSIRDVLTTDRTLYDGAVLDVARVGARVEEGEPGAVKIYVDGKAEYWKFEDNIQAALQDWNDVYRPTWLAKGAQAVLVQLPKSLITYSPPFIVRNVMRDALSRSVLSENGSTPWAPLYFLRPGGRRQFQQDASRFFRSGAGMFGHYGQKSDYDGRLKKALHDAVRRNDTQIVTPASLARGYKRMSENSELVGRVAEYNAAFKKAKERFGYDDYNAGLYAAAEARGLTDYAVAGRAVRAINRWVPFTNAAVQGLARTIRGVREHPVLMAVRWGLYVLSFELASYLWNAASGDEEELRQQPDYLRDYFWNFKVGPDLWLRIPKPWEMGVLASGFSRTIDQARGVEDAFDGWGGSMGKALLPVDEAALAGPMRPVLENIANYDFFREKTIVPRFEEKLDLDLRDGQERATRLGQLIGGFAGYDARKVDHLVEGYFGYAGRLAGQASDLGREDRETGLSLAMGTSGVLARSPAYGAKDVEWVLRWAERRSETGDDRVEAIKAGLKAYREAENAAGRDAAAREVRSLAGRVRREVEAEEAVMRGQMPASTEAGLRVRVKLFKKRHDELQAKGEDGRSADEQLEYDWLHDWHRYTYEDRREAIEEMPEQVDEQERLMLEETRAFARQLKDAGVEVKQARKYASVMLLED